MLGKHRTWAFSRLFFYLMLFVTGITVAGIVGLTKFKLSGRNACLLTSEAIPVNPGDCCTRFQCKTCSGQPDCSDIPGSTCTSGKCQPSSCFEVVGGSKLSRCRYVELYSVVIGIFGLVMFISNVLKIRNDNPNAFQRSGSNVLMGIITLCLLICGVAAAAIHTVGLEKLCKSLKDQANVQCSAAGTIPDLSGGKVFPNFYKDFSASMVMSWILVLTLLLHALTSIARYYHGEKRSAKISARGDEQPGTVEGGRQGGNADIFSEAEEDDAQLIM